MMHENDAERKTIVEGLQNNRAVGLDILDILPDGATIISASYEMQFANAALVKQFGPYAGRKCHEYFHGAFHPCEDCCMPGILKGASSKREWRSGRSDRLYILHDSPLTNEDGSISKFAFYQDITEPRRREVEAIVGRVKLETALASMYDAVFITDRDGNFLEFNDAFISFMRFASKDECPRTSGEFIALLDMFCDGVRVGPEDRPIARALRGESASSVEYTIHRKDIFQTWIGSFSYAPIRVANGYITGAVVVARDVTEMKRTQSDLLAAKEQAEAASRAKSFFLANMSHELRTPMNGIMGFMQLLEFSGLTGEQTEYNEMVKSSASHLLDIINDMLDFSKLDIKKIALENKLFDLRTAVINCRAMIQKQIKGAALTIVLDIPEGQDLRISGDQFRFKQILLNLLSNAVKFTPSGTITTRVRILPGEAGTATVSLSVLDEGIGIPEDKYDEIFEMFHQLDESHTKRHGGTGIGLAIVRGLVDLMGGKVTVASEIGRGSCFTVTLPFKTVESPEPKKTGSRETLFAAAGEKRKLEILVVDDEESSYSLIASLAKIFNWNVVLAYDGAGACATFEKYRFDAVLMDGQMPGMDGFEATRKMRSIEASKGRRTPIIALTAYAMPEERERFTEAGIDDYITKPVDDLSVLYKTVMKNVTL